MEAAQQDKPKDLDEDGGFVVFSHRYGISDQEYAARWDGALWRSRHNCEVDERTEPDELYRCHCPGESGRLRCKDRASQEDALCDACRQYCWSLRESDGVYLRMIEVHGAAS